MLVDRTLVAAILLPIGMAAIYFGGTFYTVVIVLILGLASWEFARLFRTGGYQPSTPLVVGGTLALVAGRALDGFASAGWLATLLVLLAMTWHLLAYERGRDQAGTDFAVTLAGVFYLGWVGAYFVSLRALPEGRWWVLLALPSVWVADSAAYLVGKAFGRRRFSPRLSPKKTWEGYWAGVAGGTLAGALFTLLWQVWAGPAWKVTPLEGALVGAVLAVLTPLGDLGESMIKRQVGMKDSSHLLPGHGGAFDRIDSWLWAAAIGYYLVGWLVG
jgi:phosphatidate cytidylyltransferase